MLLLLMGMLLNYRVQNSTLDLHLHDTCFVISGIHFVLAAVLLSGMLSLIYQAYPKIFRRKLNPLMGSIHWITTMLFLIMMCWPQHYSGIVGSPRRY